MTLSSFFALGSSLSVLIPLSALIARRHYVTTRRLRIIAALFIAGFIAEITAFTFARMIGNNIAVINFYVLFELIFWCLFFSEVLEDRIHKGLIYVILLSMIFIWARHIMLHGFFEMNSLFSMLEASIVILLSSYYLLVLSRTSVTPIQYVPEFWFAAAALIYFTNSMVALGITRYIFNIKSSDLITSFYRSFMYFYSIINILANLMYSRGFMCISKIKI
jgi:hypothetical protein